MDFRSELKELNYKIMMLEYFKQQAKNDKIIEGDYYGEKATDIYYQSYIYEMDEEEYKLGLEYARIAIKNQKKMSFEDNYYYPNIAYTYAIGLLNEYGITFPDSYTYEKGEYIYVPEEDYNKLYKEVLAQIKRKYLLDDKKKSWFISERLKQTCKYLYEYNLLYIRKNTKAKTKKRAK